MSMQTVRSGKRFLTNGTFEGFFFSMHSQMILPVPFFNKNFLTKRATQGVVHGMNFHVKRKAFLSLESAGTTVTFMDLLSSAATKNNYSSRWLKNFLEYNKNKNYL
jgi:hypothetical protein